VTRSPEPLALVAATDQLSLDLEAALPSPPARLRPMLPRPADAPFDSHDHLFEPSWGGHRALAFLEPAVEEDGSGGWLTAAGQPSTRLIDAGGRDVAPRLPELAGLALRIEARSAVLDGELVVVDGSGRSDSTGLEARLDGAAGPDVAYLVFDLLYLDGAPLLGRPLSRRRDALRRILRAGPEVVAVPSIVGEGRALHAAATAQGLAGVMGRRRDGPYLPGVRSRLWRYVATRQPAVVAGGSPGPVSAAEREEGASATGPLPVTEPGPWMSDPGLERPVGPAPILAVFRRLPIDIGEG
jgi:bifunctional non-homologous end joining protein LigD